MLRIHYNDSLIKYFKLKKTYLLLKKHIKKYIQACDVHQRVQTFCYYFYDGTFLFSYINLFLKENLNKFYYRDFFKSLWK